MYIFLKSTINISFTICLQLNKVKSLWNPPILLKKNWAMLYGESEKWFQNYLTSYVSTYNLLYFYNRKRINMKINMFYVQLYNPNDTHHMKSLTNEWANNLNLYYFHGPGIDWTTFAFDVYDQPCLLICLLILKSNSFRRWVHPGSSHQPMSRDALVELIYGLCTLASTLRLLPRWQTCPTFRFGSYAYVPLHLV